MKIKFAFSFLLFISIALAYGQNPDPNYYYKLTNQFKGDDWALESSVPGKQPLLTEWANAAGQLWRFRPRGGDSYQMSSKFTGESYSLEGGAPSKGAVTNGYIRASGQLWKLIPQGGGWFRLTNKYMESHFNNEYAFEGGAPNGGSLLTKWGPYSGQLWKLTKMGPVEKNAKAPLVHGGPEGATNYGYKVRAIGLVNVLMGFVDFPDALGVSTEITPTRDLLTGSGKLQALYKDQSWGKMTIDMKSKTSWSSLPQTATYYASPDRTMGWRYDEFIRNSVALYPGEDFNKYKVFIPVTPNTQKFINTCGAHNIRVETTNGILKQEINTGYLVYGEDYRTIAHELGHSFGLPDLYPTAPPYKHEVGPWDLMGDIVYATGFLGWHRHKMGWMDDERMAYVKSGGWNATISPMSSNLGTSMVVVPATDTDDPSTVYVIEVAPSVVKRGGPELSPANAGVIIYQVDARAPTGKRSLRVLYKSPAPGAEYPMNIIPNALYKSGEQFSNSRLEVNVLARVGDAYYLDIKVK